ncbi:MAG: molybdenum cofactor guanylyltransferase [Acidobacteriota bacterium]
MVATVLILAGGKSSRMGVDKRFLEVEGRPLVLKSYQTARATGFPVRMLLSQLDEKEHFAEILGPEAEFCIDEHPGDGPLAALAGALMGLETEYGLLLAVDYPFLSSRFLTKLATAVDESPKAVLPLSEGIPQYTCGLYHRSLASSARQAVESGARSLKRWVAALGDSVVVLPPQTWQKWAGPRELVNWNRPADLARPSTAQ